MFLWPVWGWSQHGSWVDFDVLYERTSKVVQQLDFSKGALGEDAFAKDVCDLLDCHRLRG